jgi:hypothetical protein
MESILQQFVDGIRQTGWLEYLAVFANLSALVPIRDISRTSLLHQHLYPLHRANRVQTQVHPGY